MILPCALFRTWHVFAYCRRDAFFCYNLLGDHRQDLREGTCETLITSIINTRDTEEPKKQNNRSH